MAVRISALDFLAVRKHYFRRKRAHRMLRDFFESRQVHEFAQLALGISNPAGNYSAAEHGMGPIILARGSDSDILDLARDIDASSSVSHLPHIIYNKAIDRLKISIGSEIAMMLFPKRHWVGNVRTIWSHLVIKHRMNERLANQELQLYHDGERESDLTYEIWQYVYLEMEENIKTLGRIAAEAADRQGIRPGRLRYMWADAVASQMFEQFSSRH